MAVMCLTPCHMQAHCCSVQGGPFGGLLEHCAVFRSDFEASEILVKVLKDLEDSPECKLSELMC
jgi:hypothetical protein